MGKLINGRYEILKPIKTGGFATVYLARDNSLEMDVVLKKFHKAEVAGKLKGVEKAKKYSVEQEIKKAIRLNHPNIARYFDYFTHEEVDAFEKQDYEIGVMEYISGGTINEYISHHGINSAKSKKALTEVLLGLKYLHDKNIIHRDIKSDNILMSDSTAKIIDFGISKRLKEAQTKLYGEGERQSELITTFEYCSPEQIDPYTFGVNDTISYGVDVWMFGVLTYYLCTEKFPFGTSGENAKTEKLRKNILSLNLGDIDWSGVPEFYKSIISKCLTKKASARPSVNELLNYFQVQASVEEDDSTEVYASINSDHQSPSNAIDWNKILYYGGIPVVVAAIFILAFSFLVEDKAPADQQGLELFESGGKYGYRTNAGEIIIPATFDKAGDFNNGIAEVNRNDSTLKVNLKGDIVELIVPKTPKPIASKKDIEVVSAIEIENKLTQIVASFNMTNSESRRLSLIRKNEEQFEAWSSNSTIFAVNDLDESTLKSVFLKAIERGRNIQLSEIALDKDQKKIQYALFTLVE